MDLCSDEELQQFAEISAWCFKNRKRIRTIMSASQPDLVNLVSVDKPRKQRPTSVQLQARRQAIDNLLN